MAYDILASWETNLPQVSVIWYGDINIDGVALALIILWLVRMKH